MPTSDERREVARRLRNNADQKPDWVIPWAVFNDAYGHEGVELINRLADLIEPEERTCRVIMKWDGLDGRDHVCSKCGTYFDDKKWHEQKFCPNCGAKVVE